MRKENVETRREIEEQRREILELKGKQVATGRKRGRGE